MERIIFGQSFDATERYLRLKKQKRKAILKLVMTELCEGLVPLGYAISLAMANY